MSFSVSLVIIIITAIVSIMAFNNGELFDKLRFNAYFIKHSKEGYRFLSYGLIHADWMHLIVNMYVLYAFSGIVESKYAEFFGVKGSFYFILLYIAAIAISTLPSFGKHKDNVYYNAVGASGAVSAVLFASILLFPNGGIGLLFIPGKIPSYLFGVIYLVYSAVMSKRGRDNIGHDAHFWGAVFGFTFTIALKPVLFIEFINKIF